MISTLLFLFSSWLTFWPQNVPATNASDLIASTDVNLVVLELTVKDPAGGYVSGLKAENFRVYQDNKLQQIKSFSVDDVPVTMGLVVDNSGSMGPKRPGVNVAALALVNASNPRDEIFVVNFNDEVSSGLPHRLPFSDDVSTLRKALWQGQSEGMTRLYDALDYSLDFLNKGRMDKKTLVVVSDGRDNASVHTRKEITQKLEQSRATVYGIDILDADEAGNKSDVLKKLSQISGGEYFQLGDVPEVISVSKKIAEDIRHRYTLSYRPSSAGVSGSVHTVKVTAAATSGRKLMVRTRTRYMIPPHK